MEESYNIGLYSSYFSSDKESGTYSQKSLIKAINRLGHSYTIMVPSKFVFNVSNKNTRVFYDSRDLDIDGLIIRGTHGAKVPTSLLVNCMWYQNIPTIDKRQAFSGQYMTKFGALLRRYSELREYVPDTFLIYSRESAYSLIKSHSICAPLIRKPIHGTRGVGVKVLTKNDIIKEYIDNYDFHEPLLLQKYIENAREFRSIVVNNKCLGVVRKIPNKDGIGNYSQGAEFIEPDSATDSIIRGISLEVAGRCPYDVLGIDILIRPENDLYIIEANRNPQYRGFETVYPNIDVASHIVSLLAERIKKARDRKKR